MEVDTKKKIWGTHDCYGCSICSAVCSKDVIKIEQNKDGFFEPVIANPGKCTDCGLCYEVCAYHHDKLSTENKIISTYAAWSNNKEKRNKCSSGGVGFEIGKYLLEHGYKAVGCRYNVKKVRAEHYIAENVNEFVASIGSKYLQSFTEYAFKCINKKQEKYIVIGTPCQIDSFRRMIQRFHCEENFILMDFFCHGVPSMLMWKKYIHSAQLKIGDIESVVWRNKSFGWHDSWNMILHGAKSTLQGRWTQKDYFYELYLGNTCLGPQCYDACKYKYDNSAADIRIGDLWGNEYRDNQDGVSAVITFTDKGENVFKVSDCTYVEKSLDIVGEGQIHSSVQRSDQYNLVMKLLHDDNKTIESVYESMLQDQRRGKVKYYILHPQKLVNKLLGR